MLITKDGIIGCHWITVLQKEFGTSLTICNRPVFCKQWYVLTFQSPNDTKKSDYFIQYQHQSTQGIYKETAYIFWRELSKFVLLKSTKQ